jgi:hypothetical protein
MTVGCLYVEVLVSIIVKFRRNKNPFVNERIIGDITVTHPRLPFTLARSIIGFIWTSLAKGHLITEKRSRLAM